MPPAVDPFVATGGAVWLLVCVAVVVALWRRQAQPLAPFDLYCDAADQRLDEIDARDRAIARGLAEADRDLEDLERRRYCAAVGLAELGAAADTIFASQPEPARTPYALAARHGVR